MDCVLNFVALACISEIDNYYASSLRGFKLKGALENEYFVKPKEGRDLKLSIDLKLAKFLYKVAKTFYTAYYYYFMAFTTVIITSFLGLKNFD
jgi:hypothetical protein